MDTRSAIPSVVLLLGSIVLFRPSAHAQPDERSFERFTTRDGLADNRIWAIAQDAQGFIWFATYSGLSKYDGYEFTNYLHDPSDSTSLANNHAETLYIDRQGTLWVGLAGSLDRFDPVTETFSHYRYDPEGSSGLSAFIITALLEDREGYLWVGTDRGNLDRFDPETETFTLMNYDPEDPLGMSGQTIKVFYEDREGTLWVGDGGWFVNNEINLGLRRFDPATGTFIHYQHDPDDESTLINDRVTSIYEDSEGTFWVGTWGDGLHTMDRETGRFTRLTYDAAFPDRPHRPRLVSEGANVRSNPTIDTDFRVSFIHEDRTGALWIGGFGGLDRYDRAMGSRTHYEHGDFTWANTNWTIYESREGAIWVGTWSGLYRIPPERGELGRMKHDPDNPNSLSSNFVNAVLEDANGALWIGTDAGGLNRLDRETGTFTHYRHDPDDANSLSSNYVREIYEAPSEPGVLWIGSRGLDRFEIETETFTRYGHDPEDPNSLSDYRVNEIYEAPSEPGVLWIGTQGGGLNRFDVATETFAAYTQLPENRYRPELFDALDALDEEARSIVALLEVGSHQDLSQTFEIEVETPVLVISMGEYDGNFRGRGWIEDEAGEVVWEVNAGRTRAAGGSRRSRVQIEEISLSPGAYRLRYFTLRTVGPENNWGGQPPDDPSRWGIQVYSMQGRAPLLTAEDKAAIDTSQTISSNIVYSVLEGIDGTLWVASYGGGLDAHDRQTGIFTSYLPGRVTYALHQDKRGRLWLANATVGLMRFDYSRAQAWREGQRDEAAVPFEYTDWRRTIHGIVEDEDGMFWIPSNQAGLVRYDPEAEKFIQFDVALGPFGFRNFGRSRSGELFFGGRDGLTHFYPEDLINTEPPGVALIRLRVFNDPVIPGPDSPLDASIGVAKSVTLTYARREFTIDYAGLHYSDPAQNEYAYRLEGYDTDWVQAGTQRSARYTGLPPGDYTFRVKAANSDGVWNEEGASIAITVLPPWWGTWWAYLLYGLLFAVGLFAVNRVQRRRLIERERRQAGIREASIKAEAAEERAQILEEVDELKSRFFANLSHEFRTPLTLILGPVQDALKGYYGEFNDRYRRDLGIVHRSGLRLKALIEQLLDLSRLEAGRLVMHCREYDAVAFVKTLVLSFSSLAERKRISLLFDGPEEPLPLYFDADKLEKVLVNLLSNAFKFTPEHGKILVRVVDEGAFVHIRVSDTGSGIAAEDLPYVFDRFRQADGSATRKQEGAGIGLALARELVELHRGTIEVESDPGFGATFTVRLLAGRDHFNDEDLVDESYEMATLALAEAAVATAESIEGFEASIEEAEQMDGKRSTVLIVEDNADVRTYLRSHLSGGYRVVEAVNGEEALKKAKIEKPDLIVSDVMMPVMDGYELCKMLKEDKKLNHIPVVLLTARVGEEDRLEGLELGADDYLSKPFNAEELLARVENLIQVRRLLRTRFSEEVQLGPSRIVVSSQDQELLERLRLVVEREMENGQFSVEQLAEEVGVSKRQLYRKLKETMDLTPAGYIRMMRLERAAQLLEQRAGTVSEIAYRVGFQDTTYFSKLFKQTFGISPSQYSTDST